MTQENTPCATAQEEINLLRTRILAAERWKQERDQLKAMQEEGQHLANLTREVSLALIEHGTLPERLQSCAQSLVTHLRAAFARVWTLNSETQVLELQASAGLYTHLNGVHSRVRVGDFKIGRIAAHQLPHLTNQVTSDAEVSDQLWAAREGMISFAGYPLLVEDELVGVMALFARIPLSSTVLDAMASIANVVALSIQRTALERERTRALEHAQQAHQEAEEALQIRNAFLSSVSHDLKTPIAVIRGNAQLLQRRMKREGTPDPLWVAERLALIETGTTKMNAMVGDLLDVAILQGGHHLDLDMRPVDLGMMLQQIGAEQRETTKQHQIVVTVTNEALHVQGDAVRLDRVLGNLIGNAIKYSPAGGRVLVSGRCERVQDQEWVVVSIQDEGMGIPIADQAHIFTLFYRASNVTGSVQGTGIGLASAARILVQHGGSLSVESEEGHGSIFTLRLPRLTDET